MLDSAAPYYQAGLGNRLCYEITFNDYSRVINSSVASPDAKYKITDISLEYEIVTQPDCYSTEPYIIMDLPIFLIAEWATLLVDIRCPRGGS